MKINNVLSLCGFMVALSGCSVIAIGEEPPECSVGEKGVDCVSVREVWSATNTLSSLEGMTAEEVRSEAIRNDPSSSRSVRLSREKQNDLNPIKNVSAKERARAFGRYQEERLHLPSPDPLAVRETPGILRVTIAPYRNANDYLVMPTQMFAEVESRKWIIGRDASNHTNRITPTSLRSASATTAQLSRDEPLNAGGLGVDSRQPMIEKNLEGIIPQGIVPSGTVKKEVLEEAIKSYK